MTNIVVVKQSMKNYLFSVPMGTTLKKDDKVVCDTARGEQEGICFTDSFIVESDALSQIALLTGATLPLKSVIGKSEVVRFKDKPQESKFKVGERYTVGNFMYHEGGNIIEITEKIGVWYHYKTIIGTYNDISTPRFTADSPFAEYLTPYAEEKTVKEVERQAKVGEYIKLIKKDYDFNEVGDILKVTSTDGMGVCVSTENQPHKDKIYSDCVFPWYYINNEYIVLENYTPPEEPEKHTYKEGDYVKIISNGLNNFKYGNIVRLNYQTITDSWNCTWTGFCNSLTSNAFEDEFEPFEVGGIK